jgi:hypothetical protein
MTLFTQSGRRRPGALHLASIYIDRKVTYLKQVSNLFASESYGLEDRVSVWYLPERQSRRLGAGLGVR